MDRWKFYNNIISKYIPKNAHILIVGASKKEIDIFYKLEYSNVVFGYFDDHLLENINIEDYTNKFKFEKIDARNINYSNSFFDYSLAHAVIHHIDKPHLAVLELYRVSNKGTLIIEGNDSYLMKLATYFNFSETYENSSIDNVYKKGGLLESGSPNYIYRWNEREIIKLLESYEPSVIKKVFFEYSYDFFNKSLNNFGINKLVKLIIKILAHLFLLIFPKQGNLLSIFIDKQNSKTRKF